MRVVEASTLSFRRATEQPDPCKRKSTRRCRQRWRRCTRPSCQHRFNLPRTRLNALSDKATFDLTGAESRSFGHCAVRRVCTAAPLRLYAEAGRLRPLRQAAAARASSSNGKVAMRAAGRGGARLRWRQAAAANFNEGADQVPALGGRSYQLNGPRVSLQHLLSPLQPSS